MSEAQSPNADGQSHRFGAIMLISAMGQLILTTDYALVASILPSIARDLALSAGDAAWIIAADLLCFAGFLVFGGRLVDVLGIRRCYLAGVGCYGLGCIISASASELAPLIVGRALQGCSAAILAPASFSMLTVLIRGSADRRRAMGIIGMTQGLSLIVGILGGGIIAQMLGWRGGFLINLPILLACFLLGRKILPESGSSGRALVGNLPTALLIVLASAMLLRSTTAIGEASDITASAAGGLAATVLIFALITGIERRSAHPLLSPAFWSRSIAARGAVGWLTMFPSGAFFLIVNLHLQSTLHMQPAYSGLAMMPYAAAVIAGGRLGAWMLGRMSGASLGVTGALMMAIGLGWLAATVSIASYWALLPGMILSGSGGVLCFLGRMNDFSRLFDVSEQGTATGLMFTLHQIGLAFGAAIASSTLPVASLSSLKSTALIPGYVLASLASVAGAILLVSLRRAPALREETSLV